MPCATPLTKGDWGGGLSLNCCSGVRNSTLCNSSPFYLYSHPRARTGSIPPKIFPFRVFGLHPKFPQRRSRGATGSSGGARVFSMSPGEPGEFRGGQRVQGSPEDSGGRRGASLPGSGSRPAAPLRRPQKPWFFFSIVGGTTQVDFPMMDPNKFSAGIAAPGGGRGGGSRRKRPRDSKWLQF